MNIGDKVVCIDDSPCKCGCGYKMPLLKNNIYVIEAMKLANHGLCIMLFGIRAKSPCEGKDGENWFLFRRFRLLDELKKQNEQKQLERELRKYGV